MDLVFENYTEVLMFIRERRDRSFNQLQAALDPPLGTGPKPTKAQRDRLTGEVNILSVLFDQLNRATYKCPTCGDHPQ